MKLPKMIDMSIDKDAAINGMGVPFALGEMQEKYPCGLSISLGDDELEKLGLTDDCEVGEFVHLFCMAKVTSVSKHEMESGENNRVCLQICFMAAEDEDEENEEEDKPKGKKNRSLYF